MGRRAVTRGPAPRGVAGPPARARAHGRSRTPRAREEPRARSLDGPIREDPAAASRSARSAASSAPRIADATLSTGANAAATVSRELREEFREKNQVGGNPLALFPAVALAVGCASLRGAQTCDDAFARDVAALLDAASDASGSFPGSEQFKADLLALLETLSRCASCLLAAPQAVASRLLPSLAECLEQREDGPDKDAVDGADALWPHLVCPACHGGFGAALS